MNFRSIRNNPQNRCDVRKLKKVPHAIAVRIRQAVSPATWQKLIRMRDDLRDFRDSIPRPPRIHPPLLSVIVAAYNTEAYVGEALESLARQQWRNIEVIVIDDESEDETATVVEQFVAQDKRFRLLRNSHVGLGAARNVAVREARGKYLAFLDSDDISDLLFYRQAILSLEKSGSDFAVGSYNLLIRGRRRRPAVYIREAHRHNRRGITIEDMPGIMVNVPVWARVYRRDFYGAQVGPQPEGVLFEDQLPAMRAWVAAHSFDVLRRAAIQWRRRPTMDAITQQAAETDNLRARVQAYRQVADFLSARGLMALRAERIVQILETDQLTLSQLVVAEQGYYDISREFLEWAIGEVGQETYGERVIMEDRVLHELIMRADLETTRSFLLAKGRELGQWVFLPIDEPGNGGIRGYLPRWSLDSTAPVSLDARRPLDKQKHEIEPQAIFTRQAWEAVEHSPDPTQAVHNSGVEEMNAEKKETMLRCWYWTTRQRPCPRVYLQCLDGDNASDTQLALAQELARRGMGHMVIWGVSNDEKRVPEGQSHVLIGSADYYEALATSAVLCFNHEVPDFLTNRLGQTVIETYHGHPFKTMGIPWWRQQEQSQMQMKFNLEWREKWDVLVTPSPLATRLYQECYPVRAQIWEIGAPRNDQLVLPPAGRREETRRSLGIGEGQTAVLYAPTYRRYATANPWVAPVVGIADPARLARRLGDSFVVVMRAHPSNRRAGWRSRTSANVIDATGYPEVNDLILASDIGLFDYSSMRFDYAVTGKPMAYYTPDKEAFFSAPDAPLWPYEDTIAGPSTDQEKALPQVVLQATHESDAWALERTRLRQLVAPWDDGHASARFADKILPLLQ